MVSICALGQGVFACLADKLFRKRLHDAYMMRTVRDVSELLERGQLNRKIGETMMNADSSRSHSVFTCILECKTTDESGITHLLSSRLNLVDLAGTLTVVVA